MIDADIDDRELNIDIDKYKHDNNILKNYGKYTF